MSCFNQSRIISRPQVWPLALAICVLDAFSPVAAQPQKGSATVIEEVVVTANRRAQNVQDVAATIKVLAGEDLAKSGANAVQDYIFSIPGADVVESGTDRKISIRGISNLTTRGNGVGASASPIGLYLGDTPIQGNGILPDIDLHDLERIEVLKGPQGTLYGEGSQGGAIKMIPRGVDYDAIGFSAELNYGDTYNTSAPNQSAKLMINLPLAERFGARLVGSKREEAQFVDYFNLSDPDDTAVENETWRATIEAAWTERLTTTLMLMDQTHNVDQFPSGQLAEGDYRNRYIEPQFADTEFELAALNIDFDLGFAMLTSASSIFTNEREVLARQPFLDATIFVLTNPRLGGLITPPETDIEQEWVETENEQEGIAQEIRLVSTGDHWLQWIGGVFYRKRDNDFHFFITNSDTDDVEPPAGPGITDYRGVENLEQYAVFGELTASLPYNLEALIGIRQFTEDVSLAGRSYARGYFYPVALAAGRPDGYGDHLAFDITTRAVTPKLSLSWFATDAFMAYVQVAKGVRSGGANHNALTVDVTPLFEPDELVAYEGGLKTQWLDGALIVNVTSFMNKWEDLQVNTVQTGAVDEQGNINVSVAVVLNAAESYTRGAELELMWQLSPSLTLGVSAFHGKGSIREGDPEGQIQPGTPMPQLAEESFAFTLRYAPSWQFFSLTPTVTIANQITGKRTAFPPTVTAQDTDLDGFEVWNIGIDLSNEHWSLGVNGSNVTNERVVLGKLFYEDDVNTFGRPRTWTARVAYRF